jgi:hypothetical protein
MHEGTAQSRLAAPSRCVALALAQSPQRLPKRKPCRRKRRDFSLQSVRATVRRGGRNRLSRCVWRPERASESGGGGGGGGGYRFDSTFERARSWPARSTPRRAPAGSARGVVAAGQRARRQVVWRAGASRREAGRGG